MSKNKQVLLAFSGGLDSTYLLYDLVRSGVKVDLVTGTNALQFPQQVRQLKAIESIIGELAAMVQEKLLDYSPAEPRMMDVPVADHGRSRLGQNVAWLTALLYALYPKTTDVYLGYVLGDSCALTLQDNIYAWQYMLRANMVEPDQDGEFPQLSAPLQAFRKSDILDRIPDRLARHTTWCESYGEEDDCGVCPSCLTMMSALADFDIRFQVNAAPPSIISRVRAMRVKNQQSKTELLKDSDDK